MGQLFSNNILLTGAGFTKDFGGLLAYHIWEEIFNHQEVQSAAALKSLLSNDFNYESIYQKVVFGEDFSPEEKTAIKVAVFDAYKKIDDRIVKFRYPQPDDRLNNLNSFLDKFAARAPNQRTCRVFFTLNQDLFIERYMSKKYICPGLHQLPAHSSARDRDSNFGARFNVNIPTEPDIKCNTDVINYIKLHGSFNWINSRSNGAMVIGLDKERVIAQEPLLNKYREIFHEALCQGDCNLLVIGYGFADPHINVVIADAVRNSDLKLRVISTMRADKLLSRSKGVIKIEHLSGYHTGKLKDIDLGNIGWI